MAGSDHELLSRIRKGDRGALGELLQAHQTRLYNVCLRMLCHRDDAAEVAQDAMLKIVQNIDRFRGDAQVTTWMTRIAMNQSISHLRRRKLRRTVSLDGHTPRAGSDPQDQASALRQQLADSREPSPASRVERNEQLGQLQMALGQLDDDFRAVLVLRDIEQMDYQQMAEVLDVPVGTIKSRLFRARLALRQQLVQMEADTSPSTRREVTDA